MDRTTPQEVDWISGSCMLIRREAFQAVDGFDANYFMYFEEIDFCLRLHREGWRVLFAPTAVVMHKVGGSTKSAPYRKVVSHHRSAIRFFRKRHQKSPLVILTPFVTVFLVVRCLASLGAVVLQQRSKARD